MFRKITNLLLLCGLIGFAGQVAAELIDGEEFADPTQPLMVGAVGESVGLLDFARPATTPSNFKLTFVRASNTSPMAVINSERVTVGDTIDGALVVSIERSGVTLRINDADSRLSLYSTNIKSPVAER